MVMKTSSRGTPLSRNPWPTLSSLPYACAVSMSGSQLERPADRVDALGTVGYLPHAEAEQGNLVSVGERAGAAIARGAHRLLVARILGGVRIVLAAHVAVAAIEQLEHLGHVGRAAQAMADAG